MQTSDFYPKAPPWQVVRERLGASSGEGGDATARDSVVFVADHWGRHPSSAQHIAQRLPSDIDLLWLETVGVTGPSLDLDTLRRGVDQLRRWVAPAAPEPSRGDARVRVLSPLHWPDWRSPLARRWNGRVLAGAVARAAGGGRRRILVTALPLAAALLDHLHFDRVVYYCVDDFSLWPGADRALQSAFECRLLAATDVVIAASQTLEERFSALGHDAHFLPHGVDAAHWRVPTAASPAAVAALEGLPRPLLLFWGLIDRRLDTEWLRACRRAIGGTVVLAGPQRAPDRELLRLPGVWRAGPVPYGELPAWAAASDALIMPYADLPVTRFMQPLKMLEYLCTDRPVVMSDLPATREWADAADVVAGADDFCEAIQRRLRAGVPAAQMAARRRARARAWPQVAERFWSLVGGSAGGSPIDPGAACGASA
jgi:glycosyltransferase involved in cell wall biosynthesis